MRNNDLKNSKIENYDSSIKALKLKRRIEQNKLKEEQKKLINRHTFIIGKIVLDTFPDMLNFNITQTQAERDLIVNDFKELIKTLDPNALKHWYINEDGKTIYKTVFKNHNKHR